MNRTKRFVTNTAVTILQQIFTLIVGLITPRIMLVYYGSETNGLITSLTQFFSYFSLVEAGLAGAAIYALYRPLAEQNTDEINAILTATKKFYLKAGYIFLSLTAGLAIVYPIFVQTQILSYVEIAILVFILGASGFIDFFTLSKYRALLTADQSIYMISLATCVHLLINTVCVIALSMLRVNIIVLKAIALCSVFARSIILIVYCKRNYSYLDFSVKPNYAALSKRWDAFYLQLLGVIQTGAPVLILSVILKDLRITSVYAIYNIVLAGINSILGVFTSGLSSSFGDVIARKEREVLKQTYSEFEVLYYSLLAIIYSVALILIQPFINIYTYGIDDANYNMPILGVLFVLNGLLHNLKTPQGMLVISAGHYHETKWATTIQGLIVALGGIVLVKPMGIYGVLIASILSNLYRTIDLLIYVPKNITKTEWKDSLKRILRTILCFILAGIISRVFFDKLLTVSNYLQWGVIAVLLTMGIGCIVLLMNYIVETKMTRAIIKRMLSIVKK